VHQLENTRQLDDDMQMQIVKEAGKFKESFLAEK
jgi:hypothetical protein